MLLSYGSIFLNERRVCENIFVLFFINLCSSCDIYFKGQPYSGVYCLGKKANVRRSGEDPFPALWPPRSSIPRLTFTPPL